MRKFLGILLALAAIGCHAQVPPATAHSVQLSWTAPSATGSWGGCTTAAPCLYAVYRCSASASTCANTSSTSWTEITAASSRPSGTSYTDATAAGLTVYYVVETVQGSSNSGASNIAGPNTVPGSPLAPAVNTPTVSENTPAPQPMPQPSQLLARAEPVRLRFALR